jgi:hypothetical protein
MGKKVRFAFVIVLAVLLSLGFRYDDPQVELTSPVSIYLSGSRLFICDESTGIHIYSVGNREQAVHQLTIPLMGNTGIAVKGDIVYANSYMSLCAIRLHDDSLYTVVNVLTDTIAPHYYSYGDTYYSGGIGCMGCPAGYSTNPTAHDGVAGGGVGGSYATFAVIDSFLYYLENGNIITMDISEPENPRPLSSTPVDWSIETLFPTPDYLFVGGSTGMYILDRSVPSNPVQIATFNHFKSCDPVVVSDTVAYVTLRGGNRCGQNRDALLSISIADPKNPSLLQELTVPPPYGLAVRDSLLYVSRGSDGFSLYLVACPDEIKKVQSWNTPSTKDFIWHDSTLYIMGFNDVKIYDVENPRKPLLLDVID